MAEYMNKETFLASMGLRGDETKYGNRDGEHQNRSYSTYMSYEIMDCVEDSIEEDVVHVVRCKDCKHSGMYAFCCDDVERLACLEVEEDGFISAATSVDLDGYCSRGERRAADNG